MIAGGDHRDDEGEGMDDKPEETEKQRVACIEVQMALLCQENNWLQEDLRAAKKKVPDRG